jgi:hypothetical protein
MMLKALSSNHSNTKKGRKERRKKGKGEEKKEGRKNIES